MLETSIHTVRSLIGLRNLGLIAEEREMIRRNSDLSKVYTFSHADFKCAEFYAARRYVHTAKKGRGEDFFFNKEEE